MHKIRLYVVPEVQQEEEPEDVVIDDDVDFTSAELPPIMQRRNSRRPSGTVRLNVIQKDRRIDAVTPKLKQIGQKLSKNDMMMNSQTDYTINGKKNLNNSNNNNNSNINVNINSKNNMKNLNDKNNNNNNESIKNDGNRSNIGKTNFSSPISSASSKIRPVFASPKIKELAMNLQEKMIERQTKALRDRLKSVEENICAGKSSLNINLCNGEDVTPRKMIRNENSVDKGMLSPICEVPSPPPVPSLGKYPVPGKCNAKDPEKDGDCGAVAQSARIDGQSNPGNNNNSVILRRNNKLNRYREYDLEQKIEVEIKMREGSARLLAAARHRAQSLEAARALLTSNERMSAYMAELQRRKKDTTSNNKSSLPVSTARVSLSDLRVPLMWRDSDHFKNRGDYRRFAVFCLARVGTEIHDTALLCPVDRALTDVTFPDVLVFNNVPADFEVTLEIYSHILQEDLSIASTPRRIKRSIHSSISRTVGKKLAASLRDELNSGKIGPHFELMASARLTLDDTDDNIHTHDLILNNLENKSHSLPLFGHFCCRLAAQPECFTKEACCGNVVLDGRSCWARIQGFKLQAWDSRKLADEEQPPWSTVPINRETLIQPSKSASKELRMSNTIDGTDKITTLRLETSEEAQEWVRQLVAHAKDHLRWRHAAEVVQDVPSGESARNSFVSNKRQGSLYDETPLIESVQSDYTTTRPTVQEIFGLTPSTSLSSCSSTSSPPSLRSRSLSTSGPRKSGSSNTLRSHWPFSNKNHD